jgi:hypothetical protein
VVVTHIVGIEMGKQKYFRKIESKKISDNREDVGEPNCMKISEILLLSHFTDASRNNTFY